MFDVVDCFLVSVWCQGLSAREDTKLYAVLKFSHERLPISVIVVEAH